MYVGKRYSATDSKTVEYEFSCDACGYKSDALVLGVGVGSGASPYFLDNAGAQTAARERAAAEADKNADLTIGLCPCPRCNTRNPQLARRFILTSAASLVGMVLFVWLIGAFVSALKGRIDSAALWIFGVTGPLGAALFFHYGISWKWTTAASRVQFLTKP